MTVSPRYVPAPQLRAGDADRDAILTQLSEHFGAGRLTAEEFDERSGQALSARTLGELDELMWDLPRIRDRMPEHRPPPPRGTDFLSALIPVAVAIAFVTSATTVGTHDHDWYGWWIFPLVIILIRRAIDRRHAGPSRDRRESSPAGRYPAALPGERLSGLTPAPARPARPPNSAPHALGTPRCSASTSASRASTPTSRCRSSARDQK